MVNLMMQKYRQSTSRSLSYIFTMSMKKDEEKKRKRNNILKYITNYTNFENFFLVK